MQVTLLEVLGRAQVGITIPRMTTIQVTLLKVLGRGRTAGAILSIAMAQVSWQTLLRMTSVHRQLMPGRVRSCSATPQMDSALVTQIQIHGRPRLGNAVPRITNLQPRIPGGAGKIGAILQMGKTQVTALRIHGSPCLGSASRIAGSSIVVAVHLLG